MPMDKAADATQAVVRLGYAALNARAAKSKMRQEQMQLSEAEHLNEALAQLHIARLSEASSRFRYSRPNVFVGPSMPQSVNGMPYNAAPGSYPSELPLGADMGMVRLASVASIGSLEKEAAIPAMYSGAFKALGSSLKGAVGGAASKAQGAAGSAVAKVRNAMPLQLNHLKAPAGVAPASVAKTPLALPAKGGATPPASVSAPPVAAVSQAPVSAVRPQVAAVSPAAPPVGPKTMAETPAAKAQAAPQQPAAQPVAEVATATPPTEEAKKKSRLGLGLGVAGLGIGGGYAVAKGTETAANVMSQEVGPANYGPSGHGGYRMPYSPSPYGYVS